MAETDKLLLTEFDAATTSSQLQVIKAFIPFTEYEQQRFLAFIVRIMELTETMDFYSSKEHASPLHRNNHDTGQMFKEIGKYCSKKDSQMFEMFSNMDKMKDIMNLYNTFSQTAAPDSSNESENPKGSSNESPKGGFGNADMFKNMLSPEQQEMYESYMKELNL